MTEFADSDALCRYVAEQNDGVCILSFSRGKDSIAAWLQLRRFFPRIVPVFLWRIPNLGFVERSLRYYEEVFETHIFRLPHPALYRQLNSLVFQPPERCAAIEDAQLEEFTFDDCFGVTKIQYGLDLLTYSATGVRASDNLVRYASVKKYGPLNETRRTFFPIYDWSKARVIAALKESKVELPVDYHWFGRSFDGIDYRFLVILREKAPDDYARIIDYFPLAELEIERIRFRKEHYDAVG